MKLPKILTRDARSTLADELAALPAGVAARLRGATKLDLHQHRELKLILANREFWAYTDQRPGKWASRWFFKNCEFDTTSLNHSDDEISLLIRESLDRERKAMERLRTKFEGIDAPERRRDPIPENVRIFVWQRDGGKCVTCGVRENLEFDHIIPHSKGGSATERNIQLLCRTCNASKGAQI